jgi:hypothetical protein
MIAPAAPVTPDAPASAPAAPAPQAQFSIAQPSALSNQVDVDADQPGESADNIIYLV